MKQNNLGDVWSLETPTEEEACKNINCLYEQAKQGKIRARNTIKKCYDEDWPGIKEKMETEGSVWYVWYMDGVRNLIERSLKSLNKN